MNHKELKELIEFLIEKDIAEFELERGDVKVKIKRAGERTVVHTHSEVPFVAVPVQQSGLTTGAPVAPPPPAPAAAIPAVAEETFHVVKSPIVGTLYEAPSPGAPPFVDIGQQVEVETTVCIIEVMKLMNSIPAGARGVVTQIQAADGDPVEYGQILMVIDPR